jgi:hypothetical protein
MHDVAELVSSRDVTEPFRFVIIWLVLTNSFAQTMLLLGILLLILTDAWVYIYRWGSGM